MKLQLSPMCCPLFCGIPSITYVNDLSTIHNKKTMHTHNTIPHGLHGVLPTSSPFPYASTQALVSRPHILLDSSSSLYSPSSSPSSASVISASSSAKTMSPVSTREPPDVSPSSLTTRISVATKEVPNLPFIK